VKELERVYVVVVEKRVVMGVDVLWSNHAEKLVDIGAVLEKVVHDLELRVDYGRSYWAE